MFVLREEVTERTLWFKCPHPSVFGLDYPLIPQILIRKNIENSEYLSELCRWVRREGIPFQILFFKIQFILLKQVCAYFCPVILDKLHQQIPGNKHARSLPAIQDIFPGGPGRPGPSDAYQKLFVQVQNLKVWCSDFLCFFYVSDKTFRGIINIKGQYGDITLSKIIRVIRICSFIHNLIRQNFLNHPLSPAA